MQKSIKCSKHTHKECSKKKWPEKDFYGIFGKNYILEQEIESEIEENVENTGSVAGFTQITDGIEGMDW